MDETAMKKREILVEVSGLKKYYPITGGLFSRTIGWVKSLDNVTFNIYKGETLGVVGESGCGKSTLGRTLLRLVEPTEGKTLFNGRNVYEMQGEELRLLRKKMQMIFQDPYSSLNPRMRIRAILDEPLRVHQFGPKKERERYISELLHLVGLDESHLDRYPHELSGGQRQRIGIARALLLKPDFIVCDEAVSALDVSVQSQIINLLDDLQQRFGLTYMFISHNLSVVKHISDRIAVMYLGEIVELADKETLFHRPLHPYTSALLSAVPLANPNKKMRNRIVLSGDVPNPAKPPSGCRFHTRCPYARDICAAEKPDLRNVHNKDQNEHAAGGMTEHYVACHFAGELKIDGIQRLFS
jgi:peptide/nickel transport system ATP-binding protein/oligopeptide transport system ATP-binding protein